MIDMDKLDTSRAFAFFEKVEKEKGKLYLNFVMEVARAKADLMMIKDEKEMKEKARELAMLVAGLLMAKCGNVEKARIESIELLEHVQEIISIGCDAVMSYTEQEGYGGTD